MSFPNPHPHAAAETHDAGSMPWSGRLVFLVALALLYASSSGAQACVGDCNGDGIVAINELIMGVNIALGLAPVSNCPAFADTTGAVTIAQLIGGVGSAVNGCPPALSIRHPSEDLLVLAGTVAAEIALPDGIDPESLTVQLDGAEVTDRFTISTAAATGELMDVDAGQHMLTASAELSRMSLSAMVHFEAVTLTNPDECEVLN